MSLADFWTYVIYFGLAAYFGLALLITIGGWFDLWRMLRRLRGADGGGEA
ncbi:MAG: hypothetical protein JXA69_01845 [Phycisphaerae bacterium]|nr:hypothetical protein [Phycisphaerae bacterium]